MRSFFKHAPIAQPTYDKGIAASLPFRRERTEGRMLEDVPRTEGRMSEEKRERVYSRAGRVPPPPVGSLIILPEEAEELASVLEP